MTCPAPAAAHPDDDAFSRNLWQELRPQGALQQIFATEAILAALRLRRCTDAEATLRQDYPEDAARHRAQTAIDKTRSQSHTILRRCLADLRRLQTEAPPLPAQNEPKPAAPVAEDLPPVPRNAACPCGTGQKYKRCCGRNAPPVMGLALPPRAAFDSPFDCAV